MSEPGYGDVLTNCAMPGLVRVGKTAKAPTARVRELSGATGVPTPFELVYYILVPDVHTGELWMHEELTKKLPIGRLSVPGACVGAGEGSTS